jgi:hypothetical protein
MNWPSHSRQAPAQERVAAVGAAPTAPTLLLQIQPSNFNNPTQSLVNQIIFAKAGYQRVKNKKPTSLTLGPEEYLLLTHLLLEQHNRHYTNPPTSWTFLGMKVKVEPITPFALG